MAYKSRMMGLSPGYLKDFSFLKSQISFEIQQWSGILFPVHTEFLHLKEKYEGKYHPFFIM